jgi:trigger factor
MAAPGLDDALRGKRVGDRATSPARAAADDPRERLRDVDLELEVVVREVKRFKPADLDEAFLKSHDFDSVDELRTDVRRSLVRARERERDRLAEDRLVDLLVERAKVPLPEAVVESEVERWIERRRLEAAAEGLDAAEVTKEAAAAKDEVRARVERDLRRHFLLERLAEEEKVEVTENELVGTIEQMARDAGRSPEELFESLRASGRADELRAHLRHRRVKEGLRRGASVIEEAPAAAPAEGKPEKGRAKGKKKG